MAKMKRIRLIGVALLALFAFGGAASAAQAETAPSFTIGGTRLIAGRTHNFDARQFGAHNFILSVPGLSLKVECTGLSTEEGVLLGSNPGKPGRDNEIVVFSGCKLKEGNGAPNCELTTVSHGAVGTTTLKTNPLVSEQVETVESGHVGKQLLEELLPAPAFSPQFIVLNFGGTGCTLFQGAVQGSVAAENLLDNTSEGKIELGQAPQERTSWLLRFPETPITEVWLISGEGAGKGQEDKLESFGTSAIVSGVALVLLVSTKRALEPNALWSPLP